MARTLRLGEFMTVADEEIRSNENVLCDVAEAVIGAICIESGFATAIDFVDRHWRHLINQNAAPQIDNKTTLQEMAHRLKYGNPVYQLVRKDGSEHEPLFYMEVEVGEDKKAVGCGKNKKAAEQDAAAKLIEELNNNG